jgi:hypothetical protein
MIDTRCANVNESGMMDSDGLASVGSPANPLIDALWISTDDGAIIAQANSRGASRRGWYAGLDIAEDWAPQIRRTN